MRHTVRQAGAAVPRPIFVEAIGTAWQTILEAPDFSVPDPQRRFATDRDPADAERRIQPGFALIEAPIMFHNGSLNAVSVEISILREDDVRVLQAVIRITAGETYLHPSPGQRLLKLDTNSAEGDRLQVKASEAGVVSVTSTGSEGAAEQHEPETA
jgi:hypothetical protein